MKFPFVSRSMHEEVVSHLKAERDRVDAERQKLWDMIAEQNWGAPIFAEKKAEAIAEAIAEKKQEIKTSIEAQLLATRRPSLIASHVNRMKEAKFNKERLGITEDFDRIDREAAN